MEPSAEPFVHESLSILERTPSVLNSLLRGLPDSWVRVNDGPGTWSAFDVIGHLNHGERTDWLTRLDIILEHGPARPFERVDREAQFRNGTTETIDSLLDEFQSLRVNNLRQLRRRSITSEQLTLQGTHPDLGQVNLRQLLATWTAHDLAHILQITRTMARRYREETGPWAQYLSVMK